MADTRRRLRAARGFTLLELMIVVVLAGVLVAVALPNFTSAVAARKADSLSQLFVQDANWVRAQAVSGKTPATITLQGDCSWQASIGGQTDAAHTLSAAQVAAQYPGASCGGVPGGGLQLSYSSVGLVAQGSATSVVFALSGNPRAAQQLYIYASGIMIWGPNVAS